MLNLSAASLPERTRHFLAEHGDVDVTVTDYLFGVAGEVVNRSMEFADFIDVVLLMIRDTEMASLAREDVVKALSMEAELEAESENDLGKPEVMYEPEKLSSLIQRTSISQNSETSDQYQHTPQRQRLSCDINVLRDVTGCRDASNEFLEHIVQQHNSSLEGAVDYILDHPDLSQAEAHWALKQQGEQNRQQAGEAVQKEQQALKKSIVASYAFTAEPSRPATQACAVPWGENKRRVGNDSTGKVRYREGIKVTSKGEKHVYEHAQADWDGGSRGKVYSKGKRGKGFH